MISDSFFMSVFLGTYKQFDQNRKLLALSLKRILVKLHGLSHFEITQLGEIENMLLDLLYSIRLMTI